MSTAIDKAGSASRFARALEMDFFPTLTPKPRKPPRTPAAEGKKKVPRA